MKKLKPCPFCGSEAEFFIDGTFMKTDDRGWTFRIRCKNCGVETAKKNYKFDVRMLSDGELHIIQDEREKAAADWNRRVDNE